MRNSGWYIPFWRKPKRAAAEAAAPERADRRRKTRNRSDEELERVRIDWISRYTGQVQALRVLGLSVGAPRDEIQDQYRLLMSHLDDTPEGLAHRRRLDAAYHLLDRD